MFYDDCSNEQNHGGYYQPQLAMTTMFVMMVFMMVFVMMFVLTALMVMMMFVCHNSMNDGAKLRKKS